MENYQSNTLHIYKKFLIEIISVIIQSNCKSVDITRLETGVVFAIHFSRGEVSAVSSKNAEAPSLVILDEF